MAKGISIDLIVDPKKAIDGIGQVEGKASGLTGALGTIGKVGAAAFALLSTGVAVGVGSIVKQGVQFNSAMENYQAAFTPLLGSADAAKAKLAELTKFAANTPFNLTDVTGASQTLLAFGTSAEDLLPDLKMLGDISQGNTEKFNGLALVFGQVQSNGHLMGQDLLQMINQGFNPLNEISKRTGESMSQLRDRMAAGKISFQEVQQAMVDATSAGGQFYNTMQLASQTLTGAFSNTQDGVQQLTGAITAGLQPGLVGVLQLGLNPLLGGLQGLITGAPGAKSAVADASAGLVTAVQNLAPAIQGIAANLSTVFTSAAPAFLAAGSALIGAIATILPGIIAAAAQLATGLIQGIVAAAPGIVTSIIPALVGLTKAVLDSLPMILDAGLKVVLALVQGITTALPTLIPAAVNAIVRLVQAIGDNLPLLLKAGLQLLQGLAQGIIAALPILIGALPGIIVGLVTFLINAIPQLIEAGVQLLTSLVGALPDIIVAIVNALPQIIVGIVTAVVGAIPQLIEAGIKLFLGLIEALPQIIIALVGATPAIIKGLVDAFTDPKTLAQLGQAGLQLIHGLWDGIRGAGDWLWNQIKGFFGGVIDNIKKLLGIHSPSTVFAGFGDNIVVGLANGIARNSGLMSSAMGDLSRQVTDGFSGSISVQARATAANLNGGGPDSGVGVGASSAPPISVKAYMLPEQDPRIVGRQLGRELGRQLAGVPA